MKRKKAAEIANDFLKEMNPGNWTVLVINRKTLIL